MYWKRFGTKLVKEDAEGTEHECNLALESYHKRRKPDIKAFFKEIDESSLIKEELDKIVEILTK